jgi:acyl-CoA dehydrogenase
VGFTGPAAATAACDVDLLALGAFARVAQASGALEAAFTLAIDHVNTRVQFGRALAKFQAVQQAMAEFSEEAAAVDASAAACAAALDYGHASFEIAAAKLRMGSRWTAPCRSHTACTAPSASPSNTRSTT